MASLCKRTALALAADLAEKVLFASTTSASSSGLFLAVPRLKVLAQAGQNCAPFEAQTPERYQTVMLAAAPHRTVRADIANVQQARVALQEKGLA